MNESWCVHTATHRGNRSYCVRVLLIMSLTLPFQYTEEKDLIAIGVLRTWVLEKFGGYYITQVKVDRCLAFVPALSMPRMFTGSF